MYVVVNMQLMVDNAHCYDKHLVVLDVVILATYNSSGGEQLPGKKLEHIFQCDDMFSRVTSDTVWWAIKSLYPIKHLEMNNLPNTIYFYIQIC